MVAATEIQAEPRVIWQPHAGSQELFLSCPVYECLYEGTRGPGKTDALLMDFGQFVGRGYQAEWKGILFRREYKEFDHIVEKSRKWFPRIFPGSKFIASKGDYKWQFPDGEKLFPHSEEAQRLRQLSRPWISLDRLGRADELA